MMSDDRYKMLLWDWIALAASIFVILFTVIITGGMAAPVTWWRSLLLIIPVIIVLFGTGWLESKINNSKKEIE